MTACSSLSSWRKTQRPAALEAPVVEVFGAHARELAKVALRVEHLEQVYEPHLPRPALLADHGLERLRRSAVAAARVEIHQVYACHAQPSWVAFVTCA